MDYDKINEAAEFAPQYPRGLSEATDDTRPCLTVAGVQVYAYVNDDGTLRVSLDYDTADPAVWGEDSPVPTEVTLSGTVVFSIDKRGRESYPARYPALVSEDYDYCDECNVKIPNGAESEVNFYHDTSCSLNPENADDEPTVRQTACQRCGQDVEGWSDTPDEWRDRGNNTRCHDGRPHLASHDD